MSQKKIKSRKKLSDICSNLKTARKKIGFTSGSFDILHAGHADYLEEAKNKCDVLIVGVNSDKSVKKYKGKQRPIIPEQNRIRLVAALESVDYTFLFSERRNKKNIELLKPDFYIKAGDYKKEELTSAAYLNPWNGKVILIPQTDKVSSSKIIEKILKVYGKKETGKNKKKDNATAYTEIKHTKSSLAVFLDRDGVINEKIHFLHEPEKFRFLPNVIKGIKILQDMKYKIVIITNQQGIGLGYFTKEDFFRVNSKMLTLFDKSKIKIDKIYFCPHSLSENCCCRKPKTGLFTRAKKELNIDMKRSFTIGDSMSDIIAGKKSGTKTILIKQHCNKTVIANNKINNKNDCVQPDFEAKDFIEAIEYIKKAE